MTKLDSILKSRDITLLTNVCLVQSFGFSSSHVWMWELDYRKLSTPVFLPGESYGQRSPAGYSPRGHEESDRTEWLTLLLQGPLGQTLRQQASYTTWEAAVCATAQQDPPAKTARSASLATKNSLLKLGPLGTRLTMTISRNLFFLCKFYGGVMQNHHPNYSHDRKTLSIRVISEIEVNDCCPKGVSWKLVF